MVRAWHLILSFCLLAVLFALTVPEAEAYTCYYAPPEYGEVPVCTPVGTDCIDSNGDNQCSACDLDSNLCKTGDCSGGCFAVVKGGSDGLSWGTKTIVSRTDNECSEFQCNTGTSCESKGVVGTTTSESGCSYVLHDDPDGCSPYCAQSKSDACDGDPRPLLCEKTLSSDCEQCDEFWIEETGCSTTSEATLCAYPQDYTGTISQPGLYTCTSSTVGDEFYGVGQDYCCSEDSSGNPVWETGSCVEPSADILNHVDGESFSEDFTIEASFDGDGEDLTGCNYWTNKDWDGPNQGDAWSKTYNLPCSGTTDTGSFTATVGDYGDSGVLCWRDATCRVSVQAVTASSRGADTHLYSIVQPQDQDVRWGELSNGEWGAAWTSSSATVNPTADTGGSCEPSLEDTDCPYAGGCLPVKNIGSAKDPNDNTYSSVFCATHNSQTGSSKSALWRCTDNNIGENFTYGINRMFCCDDGGNAKWQDAPCNEKPSMWAPRPGYPDEDANGIDWDSSPVVKWTTTDSNVESCDLTSNCVVNEGSPGCLASGGTFLNPDEAHLMCLDAGAGPAIYRCQKDNAYTEGRNITLSDGTELCCYQGDFYGPGSANADQCDAEGGDPGDGSCSDECGTSWCSDDTIIYCADSDGDGCKEINPYYCQGGKTCESLSCVCPDGTTEDSSGTCVESACRNNVDDDGNNKADFDGGTTGLHGDIQCKVDITDIDVDANIDTIEACAEDIVVTCSSNPGNVTSVKAKMDGSPCQPVGEPQSDGTYVDKWYEGNGDTSDKEYDFLCDIPDDGTRTAECYVDDTISYGAAHPNPESMSANTNVDCVLSVNGTVVDQYDLPVSQAEVNMDGTTKLTDSLGEYSISNVWRDRYDFTASKEGYETESLKDQSVNSDPTTLDFNLVPIQCLEDGSCSKGGYCDYNCEDCDFSALDSSEVERTKLLCDGRKNTTVAEYNETHNVQCCVGALGSGTLTLYHFDDCIRLSRRLLGGPSSSCELILQKDDRSLVLQG